MGSHGCFAVTLSEAAESNVECNYAFTDDGTAINGFYAGYGGDYWLGDVSYASCSGDCKYEYCYNGNVPCEIFFFPGETTSTFEI